eukprot:scaffold112239_cov28-Prasinocladus_malaysianus.AAC.1
MMRSDSHSASYIDTSGTQTVTYTDRDTSGEMLELLIVMMRLRSSFPPCVLHERGLGSPRTTETTAARPTTARSDTKQGP